MEQETTLIKPDILAVAIQEARQEKIRRLELEKQKQNKALKQKEQDYIIKLHDLPDKLIVQYLEEQEEMTPQQIDQVLGNIPSKIKVLGAIIKYLKKRKIILVASELPIPLSGFFYYFLFFHGNFGVI